MTAARRLALRLGWTVGVSLGAILMLVGAVYGTVQYDGNVHVVDPGQVVRSAQLGPQRLDEVVRTYGIHSVLNLRGDNAGTPWYDEELRAAKADGLAHVDYALSAESDVTPAQMADLMRIVASLPKPVLIHCNAGADRTGLVSALYEVSRGRPVAEAQRQLSLRYGHVPYLWSKTGAMDRSFAAFVAARAASAS